MQGFSDEWETVDGENLALRLVAGFEVVPMNKGRLVAVLLKTARGPAHMARVRSGEEPPDKTQGVLHSTDARQLSLILAEAATAADKMAGHSPS